MQAFKYKGVDGNGQKVEGEVQGASIDDAERRLSSQMVTIIAIVPAGMRRAKKAEVSEGVQKVPRGRRKISDADLAILLHDLAVMAETGVPFVEALDAVIEGAKTPAIKAGLEHLRTEIVGGRGLSQGMKSVPWMFPTLVSDMVRVAEEGGRLDQALASASAYVERSADIRKKVVNAMLYPIVLSSVAFLTLTVLIVFVMPKFATMFEKMKGGLPLSTKILLGTGNFVRGNPLLTVGLIVGTIVGIKLLLGMPGARVVASRVALRVPMLGELLKRLAYSRAFQSIATLLTGNVNLMAALEHGSKVAGNPIVEKALLQARTSVEQGSTFSEALAQTKVFPNMLIQMAAVGERTGRLAPLMLNTTKHMEEDVDARLKALVAIVEPLMIVVMGVMVGFITLSIITPIYSVVENLK
jgi:type II secretory pathway component PulF